MLVRCCTGQVGEFIFNKMLLNFLPFLKRRIPAESKPKPKQAGTKKITNASPIGPPSIEIPIEKPTAIAINTNEEPNIILWLVLLPIIEHSFEQYSIERF